MVLSKTIKKIVCYNIVFFVVITTSQKPTKKIGLGNLIITYYVAGSQQEESKGVHIFVAFSAPTPLCVNISHDQTRHIPLAFHL